MAQLADADRDMMIRTVLGEAAGEPQQGQAAVAHVIMNRLYDGQWGDTPSAVVQAKGQFEPWQTRRKELMGIDRNSPQYQNVGKIVDGVVSGAIDDPTNGATYFLNPTIVRNRTGGTLPNWAQGKPTAQIGNHAFYSPNATPASSSLAAIYDALGFYKTNENP